MGARTRRTVRDTIVWAVLTGGLVALVLGQGIVGLLLTAFGVWQLVLIARGKGDVLIDQRWADKEGKPNIRSK